MLYLLHHRTVGKSDSVAIEDDGAVIYKTCDREVTGQRPHAARSDRHDGVILCRGVLRSRKSAALPGVDVWLPVMTAQGRENLALAPLCGVTAVMQPFVRNADDLKTVRAAMNECGGTDIRLFAKIENRRGMDALAELLPHADEIVIARGDLGNAVPLWELPAVQKRIAAACRASGTPFMVVTQMLASMEHSRVPTRAEMSDVFNAVLDGAASVMVTGETAAGEYPADVIRYLALAAHAAEAFLKENGK